VPSYEHASENQKIPIDGTIKNMDGIGALRRGVERVVRYAMREEPAEDKTATVTK
jgi:hypothetical protein